MMFHTKSVCVKPLHIIFDKVDGYIGKYGRTKYLGLFHSDEKYEKIFDRISYCYIKKQYFRRSFS